MTRRCHWGLSRCDEPPLDGARYCAEHALFRSAVAAIRDDGWPGTVTPRPSGHKAAKAQPTGLPTRDHESGGHA